MFQKNSFTIRCHSSRLYRPYYLILIMRIKLYNLLLLLIVLAALIASVESKKKKKNPFKLKKHKKSKKSNPPPPPPPVTTTTSSTPVIAEAISSLIPTSIQSQIQSIMAEKTTTTTPTRKQSNLRLVYKSVLPAGQIRPKDNFIFQYTDNEEGKTCRCICRIR